MCRVAGQGLQPAGRLSAEAAERGRAYAAHFALTHLFWLGTYPAVGHLSQAVGVPATFTIVGVAAGILTLGRAPHREDTPAARGLIRRGRCSLPVLTAADPLGLPGL